MDFFKSLFCNHRIIHQENIYGDKIIQEDCRSVFYCTKCGKVFKSDYLHHLSGVYDEVKPKLRGEVAE